MSEQCSARTDPSDPVSIECPTCHAWRGWACNGIDFGYHAAGYHPNRVKRAKKTPSKQCAYVTGHSGEHLFPHGNEDLSDEIRLKVLRDRAAKDDAVIATLTRERDEARMLARDAQLQAMDRGASFQVAIHERDLARREVERMRTGVSLAVLRLRALSSGFGRIEGAGANAVDGFYRGAIVGVIEIIDAATKDPSDE